MPRKTAGASGTAKAGKAKQDDVASPPLTNEEFVSAFKAYCVEKGTACRLKLRLHGKDVAVHALYNLVAAYGGPEGASTARAWSRIADKLAGSASHKAGIAGELFRLHALSLGGFARVALALYPEAMQRPHSAYTDLTPPSVAGPPDSPAEQGSARSAGRTQPRVSAAQLKALKRFGAVQDGGSNKRARLEGPSGRLSMAPSPSSGKERGSPSDAPYDADDKVMTEQEGGNANGHQRHLSASFTQSPLGLQSLSMGSGEGLGLGIHVPGDHHGRHHHHRENLLGQVVSAAIGSSPRGHKSLQQRTAFGHTMDDLPEPNGRGIAESRKAPSRTYGMGQVKGSTTFVSTEPDENWRPPPACCVATTRGWSLEGYSCREQRYGPGALKGTLAWLRHVAQVIGKGDLAAEPLMETEEAQIYQQYLGRYRRDVYQGLESSGFIDVPKEGAASIRRSGRTRQPTFAEIQAFNKPTAPARTPAPREESSESESELEDEEPGVRYGEEYQVEELPQCRRLPPKMSPAERRWLAHKVLRPGCLRLPPLLDEPHDFSTVLLPERLNIVKESTSCLVKALGPHVAPLGLRSMGSSAVSPSWSDADEALLEEGMRALGRDFRQIQKQLLPGKTVPDLIVFYYNVWKTKGSARARAWFLAVEEARRQELAEEAAHESKRSELEKKRVAAHQAGTQNRQLRDMLAWQRLLARSPLDPLIKPRGKERMERTVAVLHEEAMESLRKG